MARVRLHGGHVQPVWAGHPWVFAQAVERVDGAPAAGDTVTVVDPKERFVGKGYWSPNSAIPVRILTRNEDEDLDEAWLGKRMEEAVAWRQRLLGLPSRETTGYRAIHAEGDGLAGLIVDLYEDVAVVQLLTVGMKRREEAIFGHVARITSARAIMEMASPHGQRIEGFEVEDRVVRGPDVDALRFRERGFDYEIPLETAQKTGFYFDQRDNRAYVEHLAQGHSVLDAFSYVGSFALAAARGGAKRVVAVDGSAPVLAAAGTTARKNGFEQHIELNRADLKRALPAMARDGERFDLVVADPPKLAPSTKHLDSGKRAYRRLNGQALRLVEPGGLLITCSCSGALSPGAFLKTLGLAATDAERSITLLWQGQQSPDHPVPAAFPDGRYLKCAVLRVD